jgi:tight adherence protein B
MNMFVVGFAIVGVMVIGFLVTYLVSGKAFVADSGSQSASGNLRSLVAAQRAQESQFDNAKSGSRTDRGSLALVAAAEGDSAQQKKLSTGTKMTLLKKLKYARLSKITPLQFRLFQALITILVFTPCFMMHLAWSILGPVLFMTPLLVMSFLDKLVEKRFKRFDADYPVLLLSYVSLLKTGMSSIAGLEAAAKGLDQDSLVRQEVELLVERLRLGLTEEQAINAFGEDIAHPEIELFVQSLILSRKVGGTLSATLERLAKQVRKRQQYRQEAVSAVGMERGSILAIAGIMTGLLVYLAIASPELIKPAFSDPTGWKIFQGGLSGIMIGFYWSRKVTNVKV